MLHFWTLVFIVGIHDEWLYFRGGWTRSTSRSVIWPEIVYRCKYWQSVGGFFFAYTPVYVLGVWRFVFLVQFAMIQSPVPLFCIFRIIIMTAWDVWQPLRVSAMHLTLSTQPVRSQEKSLRWFTVQRQILFMPRFQEERVLWRSEQVPESLAQADDSDEDWMLTHHSLCHYVNMGKLKLRATSYFEPDFVSSHFESLHYCLTDTILDNRKEKTSGTLGCFKVSPYLLFSGFHFSFLSIFAFMR